MAERARDPRGPRESGAGGELVRCPHCAAKNRLRSNSEGVPRCGRCQSPLPWLRNANAASFDEETQASVPVIIEFWASWCGPCLMIQPALQRLAGNFAGRLKVVEVNIDEEPGLARQWQVMSIPLLVVMRDGDEVDRLVGALPPAQLERRLGPILEPQLAPGGSPS